MEVRLPRLGEGADSGTVASIFVKVGDRIARDQAVFELESEKAVATIPSPVAGTVQKVHIVEGDTVKVGQLVLSVEEGGVDAVPPSRVVDMRVGDEEEQPSVMPPHTAQPRSLESPPALDVPSVSLPPGIPPPAAPTVRRVARELGIDLTRIRGSERGGRIVMADLRHYIQQLQSGGAQSPAAVPPPHVGPPPASIDFAKWGPVRHEKMTMLRKTISSRMTDSWRNVPRVTQFDEVDLTTVLALKKKYEKEYEARGGRLTLTAFALRAVVTTLKHHPVVNASIDETAGELVFKEYYHIGIAVDTEQGLIVPVLRDVDRKNLLQVSIELGELAERTRQRKVSLEEMQGGTFTISNQGGIGSGAFTPIVNTPEAAILGMARGVVRPVTADGKVIQRTVMPVSLSYDHRSIDGANAARFMVDLVKAFEEFPEDEVKRGL